MAKLSVDTIREIAQKQTRASRPDQSANWRLSSLVQTFNNPAKHPDEIIRYFPTAVVAAIEGYYKARLAGLIDLGDPFAENAITHFGKLELDLNFARAFSEQALSLGAVIMHSMSLSSLPKVLAAVTKITGKASFKEELKAVCSQTLFVKKKTIIENADRMWAHLAEVYDLRHILCHELADNFHVKPEGTRELLLYTQQFIQASIVWFEELEKPYLEKKESIRLDKARNKLQIEQKRFSHIISSETWTEHLAPDQYQELQQLKMRYAEFKEIAELHLKPLSTSAEENNLIDYSVSAANLCAALNEALQTSSSRIARVSSMHRDRGASRSMNKKKTPD